MERIYPISTETIMPHCGKMACAVLYDGTCIYGTIKEVKDGKLFFQYDDGSSSISSVKKNKKSKNVKSRNVKSNYAKTSALGGYPYPYGFGLGFITGIELALIASLFLLPVFFV